MVDHLYLIASPVADGGNDKTQCNTYVFDDHSWQGGICENATLACKLVRYSSKDLLQDYCSAENGDEVAYAQQENGSWLPKTWIAFAFMSFAGMILN